MRVRMRVRVRVILRVLVRVWSRVSRSRVRRLAAVPRLGKVRA